MKKIFSVIIFAAVLIFLGGENFAEARDVYVGTSNTTGRDCYIITDSIKIYDRSSRHFYVQIKMVKSSYDVDYLSYDFRNNFFRNDQGFSGTADYHATPIEWQIWKYVIQTYWGP